MNPETVERPVRNASRPAGPGGISATGTGIQDGGNMTDTSERDEQSNVMNIQRYFVMDALPLKNQVPTIFQCL